MTAEQKQQLTTLCRRRGVILGSLTQYEKSLKSYLQGEARDPEYLEVGLESIQSTWQNFEPIQFEIEGLDESETDKRYDMHSKYLYLVAETRKALRLQQKTSTPIESLETTDSNYEDDWSILKERFECSRKIIRSHWILLKEIPKLLKDTPENIGNLIDNFRQHLRALKNLGEPITQWDTPLLDLLISKISSETAFQWELTLENNKRPAYDHLIQFLEKRANCCEIQSISNLQRPAERNTNKTNWQNRGQSFHLHPEQKIITKCAICGQEHKIYGCPKFSEMNANDRRQ